MTALEERGPGLRGSTEPPKPEPGAKFDERQARSARHGTPSGYNRHHAEGTDPCGACLQAQAHQNWRNLQADHATRRNRLRAKAQALAVAELTRAHPAEYHVYYDRAVAELFDEAGLAPPVKHRKRLG